MWGGIRRATDGYQYQDTGSAAGGLEKYPSGLQKEDPQGRTRKEVATPQANRLTEGSTRWKWDHIQRPEKTTAPITLTGGGERKWVYNIIQRRRGNGITFGRGDGESLLEE